MVNSTKLIDATGRRPVTAAPTLAATMIASEIGVSMTRSDPEPVAKPAKLAEAPAPTDVLADDDDPVVAPHRILHGLERCLAEGDLTRQGVNTPWSALPASG